MKNKNTTAKLIKEFYEYWIYKKGQSSLLGTDGKHIGNKKFSLKAIIVCEHNSKRIKKETPKAYLIEGIRFTNDGNGNDLATYLSKTERTI